MPCAPGVQLTRERKRAFGRGFDLCLGQASALFGAFEHRLLLAQRFEAFSERVARNAQGLRQAVQLGETLLERVEILRFDVQISAQTLGGAQRFFYLERGALQRFMQRAGLRRFVRHARASANQARELLRDGAFSLGQRVLDVGRELQVRLRATQYAQTLCQSAVLALTRAELLQLRHLLAHQALPRVTTRELGTHARELGASERKIGIRPCVLAHERAVAGQHV